MADLSGLTRPWASTNQTMSTPATMATKLQPQRKASFVPTSNSNQAPVFSRSPAGPSSRTKPIEWCSKRRALAEHTTEDLASFFPSMPSHRGEPLPSRDAPSTSGRTFERPKQLLDPRQQPMLQLVAAWDSLASRLPPQTGAGPDADLLVNTLKLVLTHATQPAAARALSFASRLAELAGLGAPLDAVAIAAGILAEAFPVGFPQGSEALEQRLGHSVAALVADLSKVRRLPSRIELYDDEAAAALRELCLAFYDVRATAVEVASRLHMLQGGADATRGGPPCAELQVAALESLQVYAPLGHALGMSAIASHLEDLCCQVLFPASYEATTLWLHQQSAANAAALEEAKTALYAAVDAIPEFHTLAGGLEIYGRTKSPFSTLKKLLRLGNTSKGGRSRSEVYDLIGLRAVVQPRSDLPVEEDAERAAVEACYIVERVAHALWRPLDNRTKDYIRAPKANGYQSLHSAVVMSTSEEKEEEEGQGEVVSTLELQIRTRDMHLQAESGAAAHAAYKGGLDASQARQLREWTEALLNSTVVPSASSFSSADDDEDCSTSSSSSVQSIAPVAAPSEALFRSLDLNGDGKVSLEELRYIFEELGGGGELDSAARALLAAADANSDGELSLNEFLDFQNRVGVVHAAYAMDSATAAAAEELLRRGGGGATTAAAAEKQPSSSSSTSVSFTFPPPSSTASSPQGGVLRVSDSSSSSSSTRSSTFLPSVSNNSSSSALQSWNNRGPGAAGSSSSSGDGSGGEMMRSKKARRKAQASFVERQEGTAEMESLSLTNGWRRGLEERSRSGGRRGRGGSFSAVDEDDDGDVYEDASTELFASSSSASSSSSSSRGGAEKDGHQHSSVSTEYLGSSSMNNNSSSSSESDEDDKEVQQQQQQQQQTSSYAPLAKPQRRPQHSSTAAPSTSSKTSTPPSPPPPPSTRRSDNEKQEEEEEEELASLSLASKPARTAAAGYKMERAMHGLMRMFSRAGVAELTATWELVPMFANTAAAPVIAADASGQLFGRDPETSIALPRHGPCIIGAVSNRDCDIVLDLPTISGRHARLEVIRDHSTGVSKCVIMDLGSTNGTWVNRARITPLKEVPLYPGDVVCLAEPGIAFEIQVAAPPVSDVVLDAAAARDALVNVVVRRRGYNNGENTWEHAVHAALRAAAALEAEAASRGVFAPVGTIGKSDVGAQARKMVVSGDYQTAYMLLLGSAMADPSSGSLWAQLAAMERQRARRKEQGSSAGTTRVFLRAAVERFEAMTDPAPRREGLARVFSSWAKLEYEEGNDSSGRILFQKAVRNARAHPSGPVAAGAAKLLFTWASREWKQGDAPLAACLCKEALDVDATNPFALTLLGNIYASRNDLTTARDFYRKAVAADRTNVAALQSWGRSEASAGKLKAARGLFRRALNIEPTNTFVLQTWGVAEGRAGRDTAARALFNRCTQVDPLCKEAWHAWAKLEQDADDVDLARKLYLKALQVKGDSVKTLSALGRLERLAGNLALARTHFETALKVDEKHAPSLMELAKVLRAEGLTSEAYRFEKQAMRVNQERRALLAQVKA